MNITILYHIMPWEIDYALLTFTQLKKSKYFLPTDVNIKVKSALNLSSYLINDPNASSAAAGGDPHLKQMDGNVLTLPNDWEYVRLYECSDIKVFGKCDDGERCASLRLALAQCAGE